MKLWDHQTVQQMGKRSMRNKIVRYSSFPKCTKIRKLGSPLSHHLAPPICSGSAPPLCCCKLLQLFWPQRHVATSVSTESGEKEGDWNMGEKKMDEWKKEREWKYERKWTERDWGRLNGMGRDRNWAREKKMIIFDRLKERHWKREGES